MSQEAKAIVVVMLIVFALGVVVGMVFMLAMAVAMVGPVP